MNINSLEYKHIERLEPLELATLLRMLLYLETKHHQLKGFTYVSLKINVSDGGEDGYIKVDGLGKSNWITSREMLFQSKATNLSAAQCKEEILIPQKGKLPRKLKPAIKEVLDTGGKYALFMSHHVGKRYDGITARVDKMYAAAAEIDTKYKKSQFIVLDGIKIAEWASEFPSSRQYVWVSKLIRHPKRKVALWAKNQTIYYEKAIKNDRLDSEQWHARLQ